METTGKIAGVNGNMITVAFDRAVAQNEVGYACIEQDGKTLRLMSEVVHPCRIRYRAERGRLFILPPRGLKERPSKC